MDHRRVLRLGRNMYPVAQREPESAFSHLEDVGRVMRNCASGRLFLSTVSSFKKKTLMLDVWRVLREDFPMPVILRLVMHHIQVFHHIFALNPENPLMPLRMTLCERTSIPCLSMSRAPVPMSGKRGGVLAQWRATTLLAVH